MNTYLKHIFPTPLYGGVNEDTEIRTKICNLVYEWKENAFKEMNEISDSKSRLMSYHWDLQSESNNGSDFDKHGITTFNSGNLALDPNWEFVCKFLLKMAYELIGKECTYNIHLTSLWATLYPNSSYVPEHIHNNSLYSGVFYVKTSANCGDIVFKDPSYIAKTMAAIPMKSKTLSQFPTVDIVYTQEVSDGMMLLFPSWLPHSTQPNQSDEDRIILSFNLDFHE
jgi:uncharacterized protein (TIGR02466 family)